MSLVLTDSLDLPRASRYARPGVASDILPVCYGNFAEGGLRGPIPAVLIDTSSWIFCAAAHAVEAITDVYVDDVRQTSGYTTSTSVDVEGQGTVATITFTAQPNGQVTWRGRGKQSSGTLISNAITQLEDLLETYGGATDADWYTAALETAREGASVYSTAWVVRDDRNLSAWINEILLNVLGSWRINGAGQLELSVDDGLAAREQDILAHIVARRDCTDGDDGVTFSADIESMATALTVYYLWSWSLDQASSRLTDLSSGISYNAHGEVRKSVTLKGLRTQGDVQTWATRFFARQDFATRVEGALLRFVVHGSRLAHATKDDLIGFSWAHGPSREEGHGYTNEILRLVTVAHDLMGGGRTMIVARDTGTYLMAGQAFDAAAVFDAAQPFGGAGRSSNVLS